MGSPLSATPLPAASDDDTAAHDATLVAGVRRGDAAVFETLYRTYFEGLFNFARRYVGTREAAEEVVQEVLVNVWERRGKWVVGGTVRGYLYAAVRNRALKDLAHRNVEERWARAMVVFTDGEALAGGGAASPPRADEEIDASALADAVRAALAGLPARCRTAWVLTHQHGLSHAEVARAMGTSPRTVNVQVTRAARVLRGVLARWRGWGDAPNKP